VYCRKGGPPPPAVVPSKSHKRRKEGPCCAFLDLETKKERDSKACCEYPKHSKKEREGRGRSTLSIAPGQRGERKRWVPRTKEKRVWGREAYDCYSHRRGGRERADETPQPTWGRLSKEGSSWKGQLPGGPN